MSKLPATVGGSSLSKLGGVLHRIKMSHCTVVGDSRDLEEGCVC